MSENQDGMASAVRRTQMEAALADYPHLSEDRLAELIAWFRNEASALDVATLASNPSIAGSYHRFRADHIDRVTGSEVARGLIVLALTSAVIAFIVWRAI